MSVLSLDRGAEVIRAYVKNLPEKPGVYRMLDAKGDALCRQGAGAQKTRH